MSGEIRVPYERLLAAIDRALAAEGVPEHVRRVEAALTAESDLLGVSSHGIRMLPLVVQGLRDGRANGNPQVTLVRDDQAVCLLDGDHGLGRYVSHLAMEQAIARARRFGVGVCVVNRVTHWGRAHAYAYQAARQGMIGLCTTNAVPNMTGWGSQQPVLGNNPLAIAAPRGAGLDPVVLDIAMSQAALGKIGTHLREGKAVPEGWGLDAAGRPTHDPAEILASGLVLPMGEHKGAGLALMMEIFTGALSGGSLSYEVGQADTTGLDPDSSKFLLALDIAHFGDPARFAGRVADLLSFVHQGVGADGEFLYPGQRGWQARDRYLVDGVPIHPQIAAQLAAIGVTF